MPILKNLIFLLLISIIEYYIPWKGELPLLSLTLSGTVIPGWNHLQSKQGDYIDANYSGLSGVLTVNFTYF